MLLPSRTFKARELRNIILFKFLGHPDPWFPKEDEDSPSARRAAVLKQIETLERVVKETAEIGGAVHDANKAYLDDLRMQAKSLRPPATAHKTALQKLEKCKGQVVTMEGELEDMQKKLQKLQEDVSGKQAAIVAKRAQVVVLQKEVAESAAKLNPQATPVKEEQIPEDFLQFDENSEELQGDEEFKAFYQQMASNPLFAKYQKHVRNKATKAKDADMPQAPAAGTAPEAQPEPGGTKRATDVEFSMEDANRMWQALQQEGSAAQGNEAAAAKLLELMQSAQAAKRLRTGDPAGAGPPATHSS